MKSEMPPEPNTVGMMAVVGGLFLVWLAAWMLIK